MTPREKIVRLLLLILRNPYRYTKRELAEKLSLRADKNGIKRYVREIEAAGVPTFSY